MQPNEWSKLFCIFLLSITVSTDVCRLLSMRTPFDVITKI